MASTTFNTTGAEDAALTAAFGWYLGLGRNATAAEIKAATVTFWKNTVTSYQQNLAAQAAVVTPIAPT